MPKGVTTMALSVVPMLATSGFSILSVSIGASNLQIL